jgi:hypothetical protein
MAITDDPRIIEALKCEVHRMAHEWAFDVAHGDGGVAAEKAHPGALDAGVEPEIRRGWFMVYREVFDRTYDEHYEAVSRVQLARLLREIDEKGNVKIGFAPWSPAENVYDLIDEHQARINAGEIDSTGRRIR